MKKIIYPAIVLIATLLIARACTKDDDPVKAHSTVQTETITEYEKDGLRFMREEEKLARDVYTYLYDQYQQQIFLNISGSEQQHMDAVLDLLKKYGIDDPADQAYGVFHNENLQELYDELITKGSSSLAEAMQVGALIEELDIRDLDDWMDKTEKEDIISVYEFLSCGSRNHLRAFNRQVLKLGSRYSAVYISQERFNEIANSDKEPCMSL